MGLKLVVGGERHCEHALPSDIRLGIANAAAFERDSAAAFVVVELFDDRSLGERGFASVVGHGGFIALD